MIQHLPCQASLKIEHKRDAQKFGNNRPDKRPFVHVAVDNGRSLAHGYAQSGEEEIGIKSDFVAGRPHFVVGVVGEGCCAPNV